MLTGKGWYIWQIRRCEGGGAAAIASQAVQSGLSHVLIKVADGTSAYNLDPTTGADLVPAVIQELHSQNILCFGWQYVYGYDPIGEANIAILRSLQLGIDGFVIDAEDQYKLAGRDEAAAAYMSQLRIGLPNLPIALSSYRYPTYHPTLPWRQFLEKCDYNMPQVYWVEAHNPADQLIRSLREFQAISPFRPIIPTGSAYQQGSWAPTTSEILEFLQTARNLNMSAANFWEWGHTKLYLPALWDAVSSYSWPLDETNVDIIVQYFASLNEHDSARIAALYASNGVHVDADRTLQGTEAIRGWYQALFNQVLPNAMFELVELEGDQSTRSFTWTAESSAGNVTNGGDSMGIVGGKIVYHYSYFSVSK